MASAPSPFPDLPCWPLNIALANLSAKFPNQEDFCEWLGVSDKSLREWRTDLRRSVTFNVADKILCRSGLLWWEVWNEDTVRHWAFTVRIYKPVYERKREPAKLTDEQVEEIRASSESGKVLALRYGVGRPCISEIRHGRRRKSGAREILGARRYGDLGPDKDALARAVFAFTGESAVQQLELAA